MKEESGSFWEWMVPFAFCFFAGWTIWHTPAYILDFIPPESESLRSQMSELHQRKDVLGGLPGLFGGYTDIVDWLSLLLLPVLIFFGARGVRCAHMEYPDWRPIDRFSLFLGRVTMMLIISMTLVMLYEVFLRYVIEKPTLWANELTLWLAGFIFLWERFLCLGSTSPCAKGICNRLTLFDAIFAKTPPTHVTFGLLIRPF